MHVQDTSSRRSKKISHEIEAICATQPASPRWRLNHEILWHRKIVGHKPAGMTRLVCVLLSSNAMTQHFVLSSAHVPQKWVYMLQKDKSIVSTTNCGKFLMLYRKGQKAFLEISIYPATLRLIQKFFTERVHRNFHVSCNIETNIIQKCFYLMGLWKFPSKNWD